MVKVKVKRSANVHFSSGGKLVGPGGTLKVSESVYARYANSLEKVEADGEPANDQTADYEKMTKEELEKLFEENGMSVDGTGKDGQPLKKDYVNALKQAEAD